MGSQTSIAEAPTNPTLPKSSNVWLQGNSLVSNDSGAFNSELEAYLWEKCREYGLDYETIYKLIKCESQWKENAKGDYKEGEGHLAFGLLQFHRSSFYSYAKLYGHPEMEWKNSKHQIELGCEMIANGEYDNWSCWTN